MSGYPKEIINQAEKLWKQGLTAPEIAKSLNIRRVATIFNWRKKYGWQKPEASAANLAPSQKEKCIATWLKVLETCTIRLEKAEFKSAEGIIEALRSATEALLKLSAVGAISEPGEDLSDGPKDKVLSILNLK